MKVMIVDDEILVRAGMRMVIDWQSLGFDIVGEASNALEAIETAQRVRPDLMLVDITMPGMNGLEMIARIKQNLPSCQFIILSCHTEIEYLTSAIRLQVLDYLIKDSLNPEEITETLKKFKENRSESTAQISKQDDERIDLEEIFISAENSCNITANMLAEKLGWKKSGSFFAFKLLLQRHSDLFPAERLCDEFIKEYTINSAYYHTENALVFFGASEECSHPQKAVAHRCVETLAQSFSILSSAGVSATHNGDTAFCQLQKEAASAAKMCYISGWRAVYCYSREQLDKSREEILSLRKTLGNIHSVYQITSLENYLESINNIILHAQFIRYSMVKHIFTDFAFFLNELLSKEPDLSGLAFTLDEMSLDNAEEYSGLLQRYREKLTLISSRLEYQGNIGLIHEVKSYIEKNIDERILLEDIAEAVHLSRTYISTLFKKETGENINSYMTRQKLHYAKELLIKGLSIGEIIEKVGIQSESYFSKLFREQYGMPPAKYLRETKDL